VNNITIELALLPPGVWIVLSTVLGLLIGSFLNVCISRWPSEQSVVRPRSRCPRCQNLIAWYDNIPVLSWLVLRARCRHCGLPIPVMYPLVEIAVAIIWGWSAWHYGISVEMLRAALFFTILLGIAMCDAREYIIPDEFSIGGTAIGIAFAFLGGALGWQPALIGAAFGFALVWSIGWLGTRMLGQEAMGGGDVKMMAMVGAFLGWPGVLLTLFLGALVGVMIFGPMKLIGREKLVPFGIFLALGAAVTWLVGDDLLRWYLGTLF
jgi:leader peptidase (prepilin peptidase)/N-methyltransferase